MLFDDIPSREPLFWFRYSRAALRIQGPRVWACYFDSILNAYCVKPGGCLTDHLAGRRETATWYSCVTLLIAFEHYCTQSISSPTGENHLIQTVTIAEFRSSVRNKAFATCAWCCWFVSGCFFVYQSAV